MTVATKTTRPRLKERRKSMKYTQREMAKLLSITEVHWREIENGNSVPSTKLLFKICYQLDGDIYELFPDLAKPSFFNSVSN
ncbi:helix-turn-helix transcriptional regulator [Paenibacillus larvae]